MSKYYYFLYDYVISSNVEIDLLTEINEEYVQNKKIITVEIKYNPNFDNRNSAFSFMHKKNQFLGKLKNCSFCIDYEKFLLTAETSDVYSAVLLLLNIPLSLLLLQDGKLLLHSSSCIHNEKLYVFIGEKGCGKSTLNVFLSQFDDFHLFSDDSICIDVVSKKIYPSYNFMKLTKDTEKLFKKIKNNFKISPTQLKPIKNKKIYSFNRKQETFNLNAINIIFINRCDEIIKKDIQYDILKIKYLSQNIVGESYFSQLQKEFSMDIIKSMVEENEILTSYITVPNLAEIDVNMKKRMINHIIA